MKLTRSAGILLQPTSFPGRYGIGELGEEAFHFINFLKMAGQRYWQVLPLGPTGYGDSPYQTFSSFAGNPYLISLPLLASENELDAQALENAPDFPPGKVDFGWLIPWKIDMLRRSYQYFKQHAKPERKYAFEQFQYDHGEWLDDYALFMALKDAHGGAVWNTWSPELARRNPAGLDEAANRLVEDIQFYRYVQFQFFSQWFNVKKYANQNGIQIIGDTPIFVAFDSADTWTHPELFWLDEAGKPIVVAGVPPDYFSATGQLWGNPLYRWERMSEEGYSWWISRLRATLSMVDIVRLDHFRGFEAYWTIPAGAPTAQTGEWVPGPGASLFDAVQNALGTLPIIAEDLGVITPPVIALRDRYDFPGMRVLQFAFTSTPQNQDLPHNHIQNCIVYTGTHDNDTTRGWFEHAPDAERDFALRYLNTDGSNISWDLIRLAWSSVANLAVAPLQDFLSLGSEARMNLPGRLGGNWFWRYPQGALTAELATQIRALTALYNRLGDT